jgi:hypothetical protein
MEFTIITRRIKIINATLSIMPFSSMPLDPNFCYAESGIFKVMLSVIMLAVMFFIRLSIMSPLAYWAIA